MPKNPGNRNQPTTNEHYAELFVRFSNAVEVYIINTIVVLLILLIFSQFLLQFTEVRSLISKVDRLEGTAYRPQSAASGTSGE